MYFRDCRVNLTPSRCKLPHGSGKPVPTNTEFGAGSFWKLPFISWFLFCRDTSLLGKPCPGFSPGFVGRPASKPHKATLRSAAIASEVALMGWTGEGGAAGLCPPGTARPLPSLGLYSELPRAARACQEGRACFVHQTGSLSYLFKSLNTAIRSG